MAPIGPKEFKEGSSCAETGAGAVGEGLCRSLNGVARLSRLRPGARPSWSHKSLLTGWTSSPRPFLRRNLRTPQAAT